MWMRQLLRSQINQSNFNIMNSIGKIYRLTTFGESHGIGIGGIIDGFPAGIDIVLHNNFLE